MSLRTRCPYCNATVPITYPLPTDRRIACPRCRELFPYQGPDPTPSDIQTPIAHTADSVPTTPRKGSRAPWVLVPIVIIVGLGFAFWPRSAPTPSGPRFAPPTEWLSLAYLPNDVNLLITARPLDAPASFQLAEQLQRIPANTRIALENLVGPLDQLVELTVALRIDDRALPRFTILAISKQPFDADKIAKMSKSRESIGNRTIYSIEPPGLPVELAAWLARPDLLIISQQSDDLSAVPTEPAADLARLSPKLRELINTHLPEDRFAFLVADMDGWERFLVPRLLASRIDSTIGPTELAKCRAIAAGIREDRIEVGLQLRDAASASEFAKALRFPVEVQEEWAKWQTGTSADEWRQLRRTDAKP